jgi:hypothetical protein
MTAMIDNAGIFLAFFGMVLETLGYKGIPELPKDKDIPRNRSMKKHTINFKWGRKSVFESKINNDVVFVIRI